MRNLFITSLVKNHLKRLLLTAGLLLPLMTTPPPLAAQSVEFPLIQSMTYFPFRSNALPGKGRLTLGVSLDYSNLFMFESSRDVINDFELFSQNISLRFGLSRRSALELHLRHVNLHGGGLDKFIENFHSTFDLPDNGRPAFPRNAVHYRLYDVFNITGPQSAPAPVVVSCLHEFFSSPPFSIKGRAALGLPFSEKTGLNSGKPFLNAGIILGFRRDNFSAEWSGYIGWFKPHANIRPLLEQHHIIYSHLELNLGFMTGGLIFRSSPFRYGDLSHDAWQGRIGFRFLKAFTFHIMEDFAPFNTTPDIGFALQMDIPLSRRNTEIHR